MTIVKTNLNSPNVAYYYGGINFERLFDVSIEDNHFNDKATLAITDANPWDRTK